jgi:serine phosphatase RsbU (regulator of sigma subunit)
VEYALAGHLPILHYRRAEARVERLWASHLPLGIPGGPALVPGRTRLAPGDLLALVSDGLTEVANARDEQVGLEGLVLIAAAALPLDAVFAHMLATVRAHGPQRDDQSSLLVRGS